MNVLMQGIRFAEGAEMGPFRSQRGHVLRFVGVQGDVDYRFGPGETATEVLKRIGAEWQPGLWVCWTPELFPPPWEIEHLPIKTAAVVSDWNIYANQLEYNLSRYDVVLTDQPGSRLLRLANAHARYLFPLYSQNTNMHYDLGIERDIDVLFLGNLNHAVHVTRGRLLERIASLSERYRVVVDTDYLGMDYTRMMNRARIVFNHSVRGEMNLRSFEAPACGALHFLEASNEEAGEYLSDGENVVLYTPEDLLEKLVYYLEHRGEAERIAAAGRQLAKTLALESRLDDLFDFVAAEPTGQRGFHELHEADRLMASVVQYASALPAAQTAVAQALLAEGLERFPERLDFQMAAGCTALEHLKDAPPEERPGMVREVMACSQAACKARPDAAPLWMNLAFVCRLARAADAERACLTQVLQAASCDFGGFLLGSLEDPYYHIWRRNLAMGSQRKEHLWGAAATRLAELLLETGDANGALEMARQSIGWEPGVARPYHIAGRAAEALGDTDAAIGFLRDGLARSAFDAPLRGDLVRLLAATGKQGEAAQAAAESARVFQVCPRYAEQAGTFRDMAASLVQR